jgi:poly(hydroxyalkanoate) granule-associated protein
LSQSVRESAQQIWLAGMGAFAKAQAEGGKVFEALVKEGLNLQQRTQAAAEEKLGEVSGRLSAMADTVGARAGQNWDKLETLFENRTAKALARLGVPTAQQLQALEARIDALASELEAVRRLHEATTTLEPRPLPRKRAATAKRPASAKPPP